MRVVICSFTLNEYVFEQDQNYGLRFIQIWFSVHACRQGRRHVATWVAAFAAGTANDAIFMMLPMVDNFWQSQVTP